MRRTFTLSENNRSVNMYLIWKCKEYIIVHTFRALTVICKFQAKDIQMRK